MRLVEFRQLLDANCSLAGD